MLHTTHLAAQVPAADLAVTALTGSPSNPTVANNLTYTITAANSGPNSATGVVVTDVLPDGVTYVSGTAPGGCIENCGTVTCLVGSLGIGSANVTITVTPNATGTIVNVAGVAGNEYDSNQSNNSRTLSSTVTYGPAPTISSVSPTGAPLAGGTTVTIQGANFVIGPPGTTATMGGTAATVIAVDSTTQMRVTSPAHTAALVDVVVTNPDLQTGTRTNAFTYFAPPTVTGISPVVGPIGGGTSLVVSGTGFATGLVPKLGGATASVGSFTATSINATSPAHAVGTVDVTVTDVYNQTGTLAAGFTYLNAPTIISLSQTFGPGSGGQALTITGTNFVTGMTVSFGGTNGTVTSVPDSAHASVTTPAHSLGTFDVVATTPGGSFTLTNGYTFVVAPAVTSVSPNAGPLAGSWPVTITGTAFVGGATVKFGPNSATSVVVVGTTTITATTPAGTGVVNVIVTNPDTQVGTLVNGFTYRPAPTVTSVAPPTGPANFTQTVTVNGTGFVSGATAKFGAASATNVTWISSSSLQLTAPAQAASTVSVTVTNPEVQAGVLASGYTYLPAPVISSLSPVSGTTAGGDLVTINGSGFAPGATVLIGGVPGTQVTVVSSLQITFRTVPHAPGPVTVLVSNPGGGTSSPGGTFTYLASATLLYTITPCRILDTRNPTGPLGGPALAAGQTRIFTVTGVCGIPASARTVSANYTVAAPAGLGSLTIVPGGDPASPATSISFNPGVTRANNGLMTLSWSGNGTVSVTNNSSSSTDFIMDANGYFQ